MKIKIISAVIQIAVIFAVVLGISDPQTAQNAYTFAVNKISLIF